MNNKSNYKYKGKRKKTHGKAQYQDRLEKENPEILTLNKTQLCYHCKRYNLKREIRGFQETDSTNERIKDFLKTENNSKIAVIADSQTNGKGRNGRNFISQKGTGVYFSIAYEISGQERNFDLLSSFAALAVWDTMYYLFNIKSSIKWPNDIIFESKKLCGILCEIVNNKKGKPAYAVVGIGINLEKQEFPDELNQTAGSVADFYNGKIDHNEVAIDIINNLDRYILRKNVLNIEKTDLFIKLLKERSCIINNDVMIQTGTENFIGKVLDIAKNGHLIVSKNSEAVELSAGEVVKLS